MPPVRRTKRFIAQRPDCVMTCPSCWEAITWLDVNRDFRDPNHRRGPVASTSTQTDPPATPAIRPPASQSSSSSMKAPSTRRPERLMARDQAAGTSASPAPGLELRYIMSELSDWRYLVEWSDGTRSEETRQWLEANHRRAYCKYREHAYSQALAELDARTRQRLRAAAAAAATSRSPHTSQESQETTRQGAGGASPPPPSVY